MRVNRLGRDTGLTIRMLISTMLLAALYLVFMIVLLNAGVGFIPVLFISGGMLLVQYYFSDQVVLLAVGARVVSPQEEPELHAIVERLAALADVPKPKVAVMRSPMANAFATGRNPRHAVVCVTTGLLNMLDDEELEAVLAHEMTHIRNHDMTIITMATFFATIAAFIVQWAFWFIPMGGFGGGFGGRNQRDNTALVYLVSFLVYIISFFLIRAISRYREYAADRGSAILTGRPAALMSALMKISHTTGRIPNRDLRTMETVSALFIFPAVGRGSLMELFQTHPSLEHRIEYLRRLEAEMNRR
jgi:heat shock protein HtpX